MEGSRVKLVYVAGPYRAPTQWECEQNIRRAEAMAYEVALAGAYPVCPHTNTRMWFEASQPSEFWIEASLLLMRRCDAAIFAPDWQRSSGARAERQFCVDYRHAYFDYIDQLAEWLRLPA
jgi:nucleoside 2-deoxyribosyltransferase